MKNAARYFLLVDGFGRPFQYVKAALPAAVGETKIRSITINSTYDLWSYAEDESEHHQ
jgi:hypothetical protein